MPRVFSREQFQDGTTIDGNRLDRLVANLVGRFNKLTRGDREHRWVERCLVTGYAPVDSMVLNFVEYGPYHGPWQAANATNPATSEQTNPYKWKGYDREGVWNSDYAWACSWSSSKVSRLRRMVLFMTFYPDSLLVEDWTYGSNPPPGSAVGQAVNDMTLEVLVMNPFAIEKRDKASVVMLRERFRVDSYNIFPLSPSGSGAPTEMDPKISLLGGEAGLTGLCIDVHMDVPLPEFARCVAGIIIPAGDGRFDIPWNGFRSSAWNWSIVLQERA